MRSIVFCFAAFVTASALGGEARAYRAVAPVQLFYFVGAPVRIEALLEAERRRDAEYQEFLRFKEAREGSAIDLTEPQGGARETPPARDQASAAARRCGACHGGVAPQGGVTLDGSRPLTASQITAAQRRVLRGEMPPQESLSPEEIGDVLQDLLSLERTVP